MPRRGRRRSRGLDGPDHLQHGCRLGLQGPQQLLNLREPRSLPLGAAAQHGRDLLHGARQDVRRAVPQGLAGQPPQPLKRVPHLRQLPPPCRSGRSLALPPRGREAGGLLTLRAVPHLQPADAPPQALRLARRLARLLPIPPSVQHQRGVLCRRPLRQPATGRRVALAVIRFQSRPSNKASN